MNANWSPESAFPDAKDHTPPDRPEIELTILLPCLNEAETLATCIKKAQAFLDRSGIVGEVLIADNGSSDGSQAIAEALRARVIDVKERGYGAALLGGIASARGKFTIMGDADDSYDFSNLDVFVDRLRQGFDLVMGNRFMGGIEPGAMPALHRYLGNPVLSLLGRLFFKIPVGDFHCGLRGFNTASLRRLNLVTSGMEFASEMVVRAGLEKYRIAEVPTTLRPDGRSRAPHLKTWRDGWRHLKFLLTYSPKWLFLLPGTAAVTVGLLLATALSFGPLGLSGGLVLDINTFAAACFMIIAGTQILTLGVLARYYASIAGILPRGPKSDWLRTYLSTDRMVVTAGVLLVVGVIIFAFAMARWTATGFGNLSSPLVPRAVIAGLSLIVIAIQLAFAAFLIGILEIPLTKRNGESTPSTA